MVWVKVKCTLVSYAYDRRLKVRGNHIDGIFMITGKGQQGRETQTLRRGRKVLTLAIMGMDAWSRDSAIKLSEVGTADFDT